MREQKTEMVKSLLDGAMTDDVNVHSFRNLTFPLLYVVFLHEAR